MSDPEYDVESCEFEDIFEIASQAAKDGVEAKRRPDEQWYRVADVAMACLWWPKNRADTARLSHCWVAEDARDSGIGERLVHRRIDDAVDAGAKTLDTYAYNDELYESLGFEPRESYPMGTTHMVREVNHDA